MADIPNVGINSIKPIQIHSWMVAPPVVNAIQVPVTVNLNKPVVLLPGCVKAHPQSGKSNSVTADDPNGVRTYCDANAPSFTPLDYAPEDLILTTEAPVPSYKAEAPESPATPEIPNPAPVPGTRSETPPENKKPEPAEEPKPAEPVETVKTELKLTDYLPAPEQVTTTASIAVVATSAALLAKPLADLLLKLVKPAVKKTMKKIAALRGKPQKMESLQERRLAQRDRNRALRELRRALKK